jgi:predicted TPR repeat methyltransferase
VTDVAVSEVVDTYDRLAPVYDARYSTPECRRENEQVANELAQSCGGQVVDLGCGTGLLIDLLGDRIPADRYLGVDPSPAMREQFHRKHPKYAVALARAEDILPIPRPPELIVALFGAASYIDWRTLLRLPQNLADPGGRLFLMAYKPGYSPDYEQPLPRFREATEALNELASAYTWPLIEWRQFWVLDGTY